VPMWKAVDGAGRHGLGAAEALPREAALLTSQWHHLESSAFRKNKCIMETLAPCCGAIQQLAENRHNARSRMQQLAAFTTMSRL